MMESWAKIVNGFYPKILNFFVFYPKRLWSWLIKFFASLLLLHSSDPPLLRLKSLVTIRMNEIFPCLAGYGQRLIFFSGIETKINTSSVKRSGKDEIGTNSISSDIYDQVLACDHLQIIILYTSYIMQVYFTLNLFKKYIVILKIWMDNWRRYSWPG